MKIVSTISIVAIMLLLFCGSALSQKGDFSVLAVKGMVQYQTSSGWNKVLTGDNLSATSKIKVGANSYLGLVYKNGNTFEIKNAGEFSLTDIANKLKSDKGSLSQKLADYVMNEISSSKELLASENYRNNMQTLGSVERAVELDLVSKRKRIQLRSPFKTDVLSDKVNLFWAKTDGVNKYKIVVTDLFNSVYSTETSDTSIVLNVKDAKLDKDVYYFWTVSALNETDMKSEESCVRFLSDSEVKEVNSNLQELLADIDENSALGRIIKATFFEKHNLIFEARQQYINAIDIAPEVDEYKFLYMRFLKRSKMFH